MNLKKCTATFSLKSCFNLNTIELKKILIQSSNNDMIKYLLVSFFLWCTIETIGSFVVIFAFHSNHTHIISLLVGTTCRLTKHDTSAEKAAFEDLSRSNILQQQQQQQEEDR